MQPVLPDVMSINKINIRYMGLLSNIFHYFRSITSMSYFYFCLFEHTIIFKKYAKIQLLLLKKSSCERSML